ncbi:capsule assembly Wzi family protein [Geoalkalibacter subterraneus]|uniref:Capsule assembly Wzi family protein n=1 Tax=Geoalkalibacter subterraneus TaxID=483547 RepID=A0A0B5FJW1_9BACT|nr:capsule assembly Wzi family protein [Geoalkalibacter subterraneus]AJF07663.1 hypothetical protein GSUB_15450 [Geoalkalibacter subterraneus]
MKKVLCLLTVALVFCAGSVHAATASANIPLDSWIYPALDKLEGLGHIETSLQGSRPYTRLAAARLVRSAENSERTAATPVARELLDVLRREFDTELRELSGDIATGSYLKPLRSMRLQGGYRSGDPSFLPRSDARQFALDYNRDGLTQEEDGAGLVSFASEARLGSRFLLSASPLFEFDNEGTSSRLLEGKAALALGPLEISVGRQSLWWGQGRHGSLVLTNNAKPQDMLRITNPSPTLLPWVFKYLGPFRFDVFWSRLDDNRTVSDPYFGGARVNFRPLPWVELGASRTVMFGGKGRPSIDLDEFITILGGKNLEGEEDSSNSVAALDGRILLPFAYNAEIYGELGGEDEAGGFISQKAWLLGLYLPRIEPSGRASLRLEYADLTVKRGRNSVWYRHSVYRSGYTYDERVMGHHVGGGATDLFSELSIYFPKGWTLGLELDYQRRGADQPVWEKHLQPALEIAWQPSRLLRISGRYAVDFVENFEFVAGRDETFHLAFLTVDLSL